MARVHIRIVVFLLAAAFLAASVLVAIFMVNKQLLPERQAIKEIAELKAEPPPAPDPGAKDYEAALELVKKGHVDEGRGALLRMLQTYKESARYADAERAVGEINMDQLFSRRPMPGKLDYVVKRGDALAAIARKNRTTIQYMMIVNELDPGVVIQPGDRLVLFPLEFSLEIDFGARRLTLLHKGDFFKNYKVLSYVLPPGFRLPKKLQLVKRSAWVGEESVSWNDARYAESAKWLQCSRGGRSAIVIACGEGEHSQKKRLPHAVFLTDRDMEELHTVLRRGAVVSLQK